MKKWIEALALLMSVVLIFSACGAKDEKIDEYQQRIESSEAEIKAQNERIAELNIAIAEAEDEKAKLSAEIENKMSELQALEGKAALSETELDQKKAEIAEKTQEISDLKEKLKSWEDKAKEAGDKANQYAADLLVMKNELEELQSVAFEMLINDIPQGVIDEAAILADKALSHGGDRVLRFLVSSDAHQQNEDALITAGTRELGQAQAVILDMIGVDFVASLGDIVWGAGTDSVDAVKEQLKTYRQLTSYGLRGQKLLFMEGNHDDASCSLNTYPDADPFSASQMFGYFYSKNTDVVYDPEHYIDGYCYKDFAAQKVRVICLNTEQAGKEGGNMEEYQLKWLAETALDMTGKSDWSVLTLAHHPLDYGEASLFRDAVNIIDAFINGESKTYTTSSGKTKIKFNFKGNNCQYLAHIHGHMHAFSVLKMKKYVGVVQGQYTYADIDAWEICIPNACYSRSNQNLNHGNPRIGRFSTPITYNKQNVDGKRTSFNLVTICLDENKIYFDNYGAGIDREVSCFAFTPAAE